MPDDYKPLTDYGAVGDGRTAALIARDGAVDWLCLPQFDSPSHFAALLDAERGGRWSLRPVGAFASHAEYIPDTNVLTTTFESGSAAARLTDFMPRGTRHPVLCRKIESINGAMTFECRIDPRPNYGRRRAPVETFTVEVAPDRPAWLAYPREAAPRNLSSGQGDRLLEKTIAYWREWASRIQYDGPYRGDVTRSALALKLLIHEPTGAPMAAATTSLPEWIGGERNWDYRYSWVRDSCYMLGALVELGYLEETRRYLRWLAEVAPKRRPLPVMFDLKGRRIIPESTLDHFDGYRGSRPVRIGNAASTQHQLDIYGAALDLAWRYHRRGGKIEADVWQMLARQVNWVADHWREPDSGIWEPRISLQHHVYSKVMSWVALTRGAELGRARREESINRWLTEASAVRQDIEARGWNEALGFYPMYYGATVPDASLLRLAALGFAEPDDPRARATVRSIRRVSGGGAHIERYHLPDGMRGTEGAFFMLGFWLAQALALAGERAEAEQLFEALRRGQSPLGLYSEMIDPASGEMLGNFPQGFSHLGLIEAALALGGKS